MDGEKILELAKNGDVAAFRSSIINMEYGLYRDKKQIDLIFKILELFNAQTVYLFGATAQEELKAAYGEVMAIHKSEASGGIAEAAATDTVKKMADHAVIISTVDEDNKLYVYHEFLRIAYDMKCYLRLSTKDD
jgi:DNA-binding XRE family transcriptional regulator